MADSWLKDKFQIHPVEGMKNSVYRVTYPSPRPIDKGKQSPVIMFTTGDLEGGWDATEKAKLVFLKDITKSWIMFMVKKNPVDPTEYFQLINSPGGYSGVDELNKRLKKGGWTRIYKQIQKKHKPKPSGSQPANLIGFGKRGR